MTAQGDLLGVGLQEFVLEFTVKDRPLVSPIVLPPCRGACCGAVRLSRPSLRMVSNQAERRNGSIPWPPRGNRLDARMASGVFRDTKLYVYSRRSTVPHDCVPPGDAAIAACRARVHGALLSTHFRDNSFRLLVDLGLNRSHT